MLPFSLSSFNPAGAGSHDALADLASSSAAAHHLCVLVHGPHHMEFLAKSLRETYSEDQLHILVAARNAGSFTYDGIELGGERITQEIEDELDRLGRNGQTIKKLSIIGYSLGGLVSRYSIGLLYHKGWFDKIEPVNFTTFATPHLGVRTPLVGVWNHLWNVLGARTLSTSGRQLFTIDSFRDTERPLLSILADPDSVFIKGLKRFKRRSLYCNIVNDRSAVYYTTAISRIDPFNNLSGVKINYLKGYEPVLVDPANPVSPKHKKEALPTFSRRLAGDSYNALGRLPFVAFLIIFIPIASVMFLLNSGVQSIRSRKRIRQYAEGKAGLDPTAYSIPFLVNDVRFEAEEIYEGINNNQEYLPSGSEERAASRNPEQSFEQGKSDCPEDQPLIEVEDKRVEGQSRFQSPDLEFPTLALTPIQFAMIQALDDVGFRKFPVWIHKHSHSHAAIIVRKPNRPSFEEGKIVVKHWLSEFEI